MHSAAAATFGRLHHAPSWHLPSTSSCSSSGSSRVRIPSSPFNGGASRGATRAGAARRGPPGEQRFPVGEYGERIVVASYDDEEEGNTGDIKLECDESGCVIVKTVSKTLEEEDDKTGYLCCDLTGLLTLH